MRRVRYNEVKFPSNMIPQTISSLEFDSDELRLVAVVLVEAAESLETMHGSLLQQQNLD
jgi:hypothetical protein